MKRTTAHDQLTLRIGGPVAVLSRIAAVATNTLREAGRNRVFYGLLVAAVALLAFSVVLSDLALVDQRARLVQDFGLFAIPLLTIATAVLMGALLLHKEIERKTLNAILPKPIRRSEFVIGKFLGLCALLGGMMAGLGLCWWAVLALRQGEMTRALALALGLQYVEVMLVTAVALFFASLSRPVLAGALTVGVFVVGRVGYVVKDLLVAQKGVFAEVPFMRALGKVLLAALPDLSTFNVADEVLLGWVVPADYVLAAVGYGLAWTGFFLALALVLFERRDLT
jgi:ABC-type transport system involved in multi-copper enzyme maturation permease subunit